MAGDYFRFIAIISLCTILSLGQHMAIELNTCFTSTTGREKKAGNSTIFTVINKYGTCYSKHQRVALSEIYEKDELRVRAITRSLELEGNQDSYEIVTYSGTTVGGGNYVAQAYLGTPSKKLNLEIDTGSDITWTQCSPCILCFPQNDTLFNPLESSTYSNVSCLSSSCISNTCLDSACGYRLEYGGRGAYNSYTVGILATDTINFCNCDTEVFPNFVFGCGYENGGQLIGSDGLLGLGRGSLSLIAQTASLYKSFFSYCLPQDESGTGFLSLGGKVGSESGPVYASFSNSNSKYYTLDLYEIDVGDSNVTLPYSIPILIDSGTMSTRLPTALYDQVKKLFDQKMSKYASAPSHPPYESCYNISGYTDLSNVPPEIDFYFNDDIAVTLFANSLVLPGNSSVACLDFLPNESEKFAIFGSQQQRTMEVIFDIPKRRIGFARGRC